MNQLAAKIQVERSRLALKQASVGSSPDVPYEQALANIAHDYLRSRSPTLLEYEIGFQLVDKSKGGEKALGAFGFKVGERNLIVPVVYYDGEVSGHEIIYVVDQNICVPSTEGWVSYLTQKQPDTIGSPVGSNRSALGIRGAPLNLITRSPLKYASASAQPILNRYPEWCHPFIKWAAQTLNTPIEEQMNWAPSLGAYFAKQSVDFHEAFFKMLRDFPVIKAAAEKMNPKLYPELEGSLATVAEKAALPRITGSILGNPDKEPTLKVFKYVEVSKAVVPYDFSDSDKEKLVQQGYIVKDKRKDNEKPKVYPNPVNQETLQLQHPTENTIDNVLVRPGVFERCLVLVKQVSPDCPYYNGANVIRFRDKKVKDCDRNAVFLENDPLDLAELQKFLGSLPEAKGYDFSKDSTYVLLCEGKGLEASCCFKVERNFGKQGEDRLLAIRPVNTYGPNRSAIGAGRDHSNTIGTAHKGYRESEAQLRICDRSTSMRAWQNEIIVPPNARVVKLSVPDWNERDDKFEMGDMRDMASIMWKGLTKLDVRRGHGVGREYSIDQKELTTKKAAVLDLVERHQLAEDDAEAVLDMVPAGSQMTFGVKKALGNPMPWLNDDGKSETPDIPWKDNTGGNWLANPNTENDSTVQYNLPVQGMIASQNDPSAWDPRIEPEMPGMQQALAASQKGQRDVFNVKAVLSIVNKDQSGDMGPILTCMDALARRYLAFRWQREDMNDQYGTADASDIEDSLLENFESLGEMIIAMYERDLRNGDRSELLRQKLTVHSEDTGDQD
jgi:hypothetical protein